MADRLREKLRSVYGRELLHWVGPDRLRWVSDRPFGGLEREMTYQQSIDAVTAWVPEGPLLPLVQSHGWPVGAPTRRLENLAYRSS